MSLVITGMHRSGTSSVARVVDHLGLGPGSGRSMETVPENPRGFFERADVADFNDRWLERLGGSWEAPPRSSRADFANLGDNLFHEARAQLDLFSPDSGSWYVKDPRIALILPIWDRLSLRTLPTVLVVRSPREVAHSLRLRNSFPAGLGLALWLAYNNAVLRNAEFRDVLVLDYEQVLSDPRGTVTAIHSFLVERTGADLSAADTAGAASLLEPGLRRQQEPELDQLGERMASDVAELHESLSRIHGEELAGRVDPVPVPAWADEWLNQAAELFRVRHEAELRVKLALHERDEMERDLATLQDEVAAVRASRSYRYGSGTKRALLRTRDRVRSRSRN